MRLFSLASLLFASSAVALSTTGNNLLVVVDEPEQQEQYSVFLGDLSKRGFNVQVHSHKNADSTLFHLGERVYDHVMILPSKAKSLSSLTPASLLQFLDAQGNVMVVLSGAVSVPVTVASFLNELEIYLPTDRNGVIIDHFQYDTLSAPKTHDVLALDAPAPIKQGHQNYFTADNSPVLAVPRAMPHMLGNSALVTPILRAPETSYSYNPQDKGLPVDAADIFAAGRQNNIVSSMISRNNARVSVVGSAEMLQDAWFKVQVDKVGGPKTPVWNREFARRISGWTFQELGVLRVNEVVHRLAEKDLPSEPNPKIYRIKHDITYSISLSEYSWDSWGPFRTPIGDNLQLEFSMLSPFHRRNLERTLDTPDASVYKASFKTPDQHGIFNFMVNYKRPFMTYIEEKNTVTVRHLAHDEFTRSYAISGSWPWIAGIVSTCGGFVMFCLVFLYSKPEIKGETKKKQ